MSREFRRKLAMKADVVLQRGGVGCKRTRTHFLTLKLEIWPTMRVGMFKYTLSFILIF